MVLARESWAVVDGLWYAGMASVLIHCHWVACRLLNTVSVFCIIFPLGSHPGLFFFYSHNSSPIFIISLLSWNPQACKLLTASFKGPNKNEAISHRNTTCAPPPQRVPSHIRFYEDTSSGSVLNGVWSLHFRQATMTWLACFPCPLWRHSGDATDSPPSPGFCITFPWTLAHTHSLLACPSWFLRVLTGPLSHLGVSWSCLQCPLPVIPMDRAWLDWSHTIHIFRFQLAPGQPSAPLPCVYFFQLPVQLMIFN